MSSARHLRTRLAAGRVYAAVYGLGGRFLRWALPPGSWLAQQKQRIANKIRPVPRRKLGFLLAAFAESYPRARFVQIGANDGVLEDPLREFVTTRDWRGVLVEPVPYLFERLRETYRGVPGAILENVAIAEKSGSLPFYYVRENSADTGVPEWHRGLGSFSREVVMKHADRIPGLAQRLVTQEVPCLSFAALCARHGIDGLELLHMDTEGYDYEILKTVDLERFRPRVLVYEHHHLGAEDRAACLAHLAAHGYEAMEEGLDVICVNTCDPAPHDAPLLDAWRVLRRTERIPA